MVVILLRVTLLGLRGLLVVAYSHGRKRTLALDVAGHLLGGLAVQRLEGILQGAAGGGQEHLAAARGVHGPAAVADARSELEGQGMDQLAVV